MTLLSLTVDSQDTIYEQIEWEYYEPLDTITEQIQQTQDRMLDKLDLIEEYFRREEDEDSPDTP
ncbi:MAG: hypothetical protein ACQ9ET_00040 [Nitrosomonadaceae bacterium]